MKPESKELENYKKAQRMAAYKRRKAYAQKRFNQRVQSGRAWILFFKIFRAICMIYYGWAMISLTCSGHWLGSLVFIPFGLLTWMAFGFYTSKQSIHHYQDGRGKLRRKW